MSLFHENLPQTFQFDIPTPYFYLFIFKIIYAIQWELTLHGRFVLFIFIYPAHMFQFFNKQLL